VAELFVKLSLAALTRPLFALDLVVAETLSGGADARARQPTEMNGRCWRTGSIRTWVTGSWPTSTTILDSKPLPRVNSPWRSTSIRRAMLAKRRRFSCMKCSRGSAISEGRRVHLCAAGHNPEAVKWLRDCAAAGFRLYPRYTRDALLNRIRQSAEFTAVPRGDGSRER